VKEKEIDYFTKIYLESMIVVIIFRFTPRSEMALVAANLADFLRTHSKDETFITNVKAVLIVSDFDTDESFSEVQRELANAKDFPVPDVERVPKRQSGAPSVVVLMIPIGAKGSLESLCLPAAYSKWGLKENLDNFVEKTPASQWSVGKQAKMRMQTILAATNKKRPVSGFASHFSSPEEYRIPLDHQCFAEIISFIRGFGNLIEA
jgi:hypothetical protein